LQLSFLL